jgi:hypothetical protein
MEFVCFCLKATSSPLAASIQNSVDLQTLKGALEATEYNNENTTT